MRKYKAVILDLFDTVINFNRSRLPAVSIDGAEVRSTSGAVYKVFREFYSRVTFDEFYDVFMESYAEFNESKRKEHREFHNRERFKLMLRKMNLEPNSHSDELIEGMVLAHMEGLASSMEFPEENRKALDLIRDKSYRLAIISNFDHAPTAYGLLRKFGIKDYFEQIVISIDVGWRKPKADIFLKAFNLLKIRPEDAIFVGDNYEADVVGSKAVGMDVIWVNKNGELVKGGTLKPDYIIPKFADIKEIL